MMSEAEVQGLKGVFTPSERGHALQKFIYISWRSLDSSRHPLRWLELSQHAGDITDS